MKWARLRCVNIGDANDTKKYGLISSFTSCEYSKRAVVETFENLLYGSVQHPEAKSLGPDGQPCKGDTHGLLGRAHIIAGRHRRIGKESDRRWEEVLNWSHCPTFQCSLNHPEASSNKTNWRVRVKA
jgi:hypothetical protein